MAVEYRILCDGCGAVICSSRESVKHARADAAMKHKANHGPDGDKCQECRQRYIDETNKTAWSMASKAHSISAGTAWPEGAPRFGVKKETGR